MADPPTQPRCPECGTPAAEVAPRAPWWHQRRRVFQAIALLAFLVFLGVKQWEHWPQPPSLSASRPGVTHVEFPSTRFTRTDLEAMAPEGSPEGEGDQILRAMGIGLDLMLIEDAELVAAFLVPEAQYCEMVRWGWPADIRFIRYDATFEDVYARTGITPDPPRGRVGWVPGWAHYQEGVDPAKGRRLTVFVPRTLGSSILVVVVAWFVGKFLAMLAAMAIGSGRSALRTRVRRVVPAAIAAAALLGVVVLSLERRVDTTGLMTPTVVWPPTGPTGLTTADLRGLLDTPDSDRVAARAILAAASQAPMTGNVLALGWNVPRPIQSGQIRGFWPRAVLDGGLTVMAPGEEPFDAPWRRSRWRAEWSRGYLTIRRDEVGGSERYRRYVINLTNVAWPVLGLIAVWLAPAVPIGLAMWRRSRRARGRAAAGQCVRCGYEGVRPVLA